MSSSPQPADRKRSSPDTGIDTRDAKQPRLCPPSNADRVARIKAHLNGLSSFYKNAARITDTLEYYEDDFQMALEEPTSEFPYELILPSPGGEPPMGLSFVDFPLAKPEHYPPYVVLTGLSAWLADHVPQEAAALLYTSVMEPLRAHDLDPLVSDFEDFICNAEEGFFLTCNHLFSGTTPGSEGVLIDVHSFAIVLIFLFDNISARENCDMDSRVAHLLQSAILSRFKDLLLLHKDDISTTASEFRDWFNGAVLGTFSRVIKAIFGTCPALLPGSTPSVYTLRVCGATNALYKSTKALERVRDLCELAFFRVDGAGRMIDQPSPPPSPVRPSHPPSPPVPFETSFPSMKMRLDMFDALRKARRDVCINCEHGNMEELEYVSDKRRPTPFLICDKCERQWAADTRRMNIRDFLENAGTLCPPASAKLPVD